MDASPIGPVTANELLDHLGWIRQLARSLVRDPDRAADLEQETWKHALERPAIDRRNVRGWLTRIAHNLARERARGEKARAWRERAASRDEALPSSGDIVAEAALQRALVGHVLELDEPYRSTILLRYFRDLSPSAIAVREGIALNTVRSRIVRGLERLRERLDRTQGGRETWMRVLAASPAPVVLLKAGATSALVTAAVIIALIAAIGATAWVGVTTGDRSRSAGSSEVALAPLGPASSTAAVEAGRPGSFALGELERAARSRVVADTASTSVTRSGTLDFYLVDAETNEPVAGLEYVVYSERRGNERLALGTTDAQGRARVPHLPEDVILVQTERKPPYAPSVRALWLAQKSRRDLEISLGAGGTIVGRVVDDQGTPRPGMQVLMPGGASADSSLTPAIPRAQQVVAETDDEGRFRVTHAQSRPAGVWIVGGEERPERFDPVSLSILDPRWRRIAGFANEGLGIQPVQVEAGQTVELPDQVLPRDVRLSGVVRYADGQPAAGVLVSPNIARSSELSAARAIAGTGLTDVDALVAAEGEVWTGPDGAFDVASPLGRSPTTTVLALCTRTGIRKLVHVPDTRAGVHVERLAFELELRAPFEIAVELEEAGAVPRSWFKLEHHLCDGTLRKEHLFLDAGSILRPEYDPTWNEVRSIELSYDGWSPARIDLPDGLADGGRAQLRLERRPRIVVAVEWAPQGVEVSPTLSLNFSACLASPEVRTGSEPGACCGLGGTSYANGPTSASPIEIAVPTRRPYWIYVRGNDRERSLRSSVHGPFVASDERYVLQLDASLDAGPCEEMQAKRPPPKLSASEECALAANILDARSGAPVVHSSLELRRKRGDRIAVGDQSFRADTEGRVGVKPRAGTWYPVVQQRGYARLELAPITLEPGAGVDLGTLKLHPLPVFRAHFIDAAGAPVANLYVSVPGALGETDEHGNVELRADLPASFLLTVHEGRAFGRPSASGEQAFRISEWNEGGSREIALRPWHEVAIEIDGFDPDMRGMRLGVTVEFRDFTDDAKDEGDGIRSAHAVEIAPSGGDARRFAIRLAAGRYRLHVSSLALDVPPLDFTVDEQEAGQTVRMSVH